ncbi:MAG: tRNA-dihydrouridine synthase [Candidatus Omnitrophota bacterium]|jgi:tRNA-dihydrouridine synthase B
MLKIGDYTLESKLILAPLSGCSDLPFRLICREHGCKFAFYEMLDAHGITYGHRRTLSMLETDKRDSPIGVQILGNDPERVLEAVQIILNNSNSKIIDLNCACPALKVLKKKCGAYLLKEPEQAGRIIKKLSSCLSTPITIKLRAGWGREHQNEGLLLAKIAQDNGAKAVFFHGRSCSQGYSGKASYEPIKQAKEALKIPVIGSGDVLSPEIAKDMLDRTGCDGVLIARGAFGAPWIFAQTEKYLKDGLPSSLASYEIIVNTAKRHIQIFKDWKDRKLLCHNEEASNRQPKQPTSPAPEKYYIGHLRKIAMWYSKGLPYSKRARETISFANSFDEIIGILDRLKNDYDIKWLKR